MEHVATIIVESVLLPPGLLLILLVAGILVLNKSPVLGKAALWSVVIVIYGFCTPLVSGLLVDQVEIFPALSDLEIRNSDAGAIVILSGGRHRDAREYGGDTVDELSLVRCRYGAYLHRKTGLPILVSGGWVFETDGKSLSQVMAEVLREEFQVDEIWLEDKSRTTAENAVFSARILARKGIGTILLVTQAWHMPRSVRAFEKAGLKVIPAPTAFEGNKQFEFRELLPNANALWTSHFALHEMIGALWYRIRY